MYSRYRGFTMTELLIVMVIAGIIAAIAVPSYIGYMTRGYRAEARAILMENSQFMERNFTAANRYDEDSAGDAVELPYTQSPKTGDARYTIDLGPTTSSTSFTLRAIPTGSMAGDDCGTYTLKNDGSRGNTSATLTEEECWGH